MSHSWSVAMPANLVRKPISEPIVCGLVRVADGAAILGGGLSAYIVWLAGAPDIDATKYAFVTLFGVLLGMNIMHWNRVYTFDTLQRLPLSLSRTVGAALSAGGILLALSFVTKTTEDFSRVWAALWFATAILLLGGVRLCMTLLIRNWTREGRLYRNVVVVGTGAISRRLLAHVTHSPGSGMRVLGVFDDASESRPRDLSGYRLLGDVEALVDYARRNPVDAVIIALPWSAEQRIAAIIERLNVLPVDVRLCPDMIGFRLRRSGVSHLGDVPMLTVFEKPFADWRLVIKVVEDRLLSTLILMLIGLPMLAIALAIKLDSPGPVFFRQKRYGFNNQLIEVLKFRTMYHSARDENAERLTSRNDPRVTRLGAFLRRASLDELPQFLNVLRGDMSIVGPRPHALSAKAGGLLYQEAVREYAARHRVKPGITGWAQINGWRGETETLEQIKKRVEHDLAYIENWSLLLDLKIIFRTVFTGFIGQRAY
jgi:Undecaprenyl-phosphate glucose phosphotransferase